MGNGRIRKFLAAVTATIGVGWGAQQYIDQNNVEKVNKEEKIEQKSEQSPASPKESKQPSNQDKNLIQVKKFNKNIYDTQKKAIQRFLEVSEFSENLVLNHINKEAIKGDDIHFSKLNPELARILYELSLEEKVSPRLVIAIATIESSFGKYNTSQAGAKGPLQAMKKTMHENCSEYLEDFKSEKAFENDLYVQIRAGIREIKKIADGYHINVAPYYTTEINPDELILILASYNKGYGAFKYYPYETLLNTKETREYVAQGLSILFKFNRYYINETIRT